MPIPVYSLFQNLSGFEYTACRVLPQIETLQAPTLRLALSARPLPT